MHYQASGGSTIVNAYRVILKSPTASTSTLDTFAHADYRGAKYYISATSTVDSSTMNAAGFGGARWNKCFHHC